MNRNIVITSWHVMTCEITAPPRKRFLWMQMADPPAWDYFLKKVVCFLQCFWTFSIFVVFLEYQFFHCFFPLIVFFECISFLEILLDLIDLSLPFFFSPFLHTLLSFQKKHVFFWIVSVFAVSFFCKKDTVFPPSSCFFCAKESELRDKNLISLEEFILPVNFLKANDIIILSKPRKRDVFLFSAQLWRCWRSN